MDPAHRDRLAFARICSGRFERGMTVTCDRTGRELTTKYATTAFGADRETVEEAFPGDIVGLVNATGLQLGDTIYAGGHDGSPVTFPAIPRFSPEVFATARPLDTGRAKQFRRGLEQLDEEGVVQVLRDPDASDTSPVLAAVGATAVRRVRPPAGERVQRPGRDPHRRLPGDPANRCGVDPPASRDRRHPHPAPLRRRAWSPCSRTATGSPASSTTSPT